MRLIHRYLPRACADGGDIEARAHMLAAASMGRPPPEGSGRRACHRASRGVLVQHSPRVDQRGDSSLCHDISTAVQLPIVGGHRTRSRSAGQTSYEGFFDWVLEMRRDLGIPHSLAGIGVSADMATSSAARRRSTLRPAATRSRSTPRSWRAFSGPRSPEISRRWMAPGDGPSNPDHRTATSPRFAARSPLRSAMTREPVMRRFCGAST